ncbi:phage tail tape measure protein [Aquabacter spiritensis]|uniref:Lambda family phage tail tape measure protein n=1 Tax=Aquabacter spiritensis TaxID=933073 RepID=A0A4R3M327_9HYPH|nr:phage tail tape measure protein [Aquabacter spiritensis]TCT07621.1 lambda family phage tail tape measure protein [Aquabacter spiritensis]
MTRLDTPIDSVSIEIGADTRAFRLELANTERLARGFATTLGDAFTGVAVKGRDVGDVVAGIGQRLSALALNLALRPVEEGMAGLFSSLLGTTGFAQGGIVADGVRPFAKGGVVAAPTYFPLPGGTGLMGEAGAEAILPLARGADGALGVRTAGAGGRTSVVVNVATPDPSAFRRSDAYLSGLVARAVARGQRGA